MAEGNKGVECPTTSWEDEVNEMTWFWIPELCKGVTETD